MEGRVGMSLYTILMEDLDYYWGDGDEGCNEDDRMYIWNFVGTLEDIGLS